MRALLIGGTGHVSGAIARSLLAANYELTILTDGRGHLSAPSGVEDHVVMDRGDILSNSRAMKRLTRRTWDLVVDSICFSDEHARSASLAFGACSSHTIVISTAYLYSQLGAPFHKESDPIVLPSHSHRYLAGKSQVEKVWLDAYRDDGLPVTIVRPPHVLIPGAALGILPIHNRDPGLVDRILASRDLYLAEGGVYRFQVVFVDDFCRMLLRLARRAKAFGRIYNCASPEVISARSYYEFVGEALGKSVSIRNVSRGAILNSSWGWEITLRDWLFDIGAVTSDFGEFSWTPARRAIADCVVALPRNTLVRRDSAADRYSPLDALLRGTDDEAISRALDSLAASRPRTGMDLRMNKE